MAKAGAQVLIKNIIREIAQECASKGQIVSETLVAFIVKGIVLDPNNGFNVDRKLTREDIQRLVYLCVDRLLDTKSPALDTIKMQVYFDMNYVTRSEFFQEHRRVLEQRLVPVIREITDVRAKSREELETLYRKIVSFVLLRSGLGSPTDIAVVREAMAALQSVFPQTELGTFMSLSKRDKERQLQELTMLVSGIRLFNKDSGKGGEGIDDLPAILNEAIPATTQQVDHELKAVLQHCFKYTALCEKLQDAVEFRSNFGGASGLSLKLLKEAVINTRQHEGFLRILLSDLVTCAQQVEFLEQQLAQRLEHLRATVSTKTAVPTSQVYPQFVHLSQVWTGFQDEMVFLSVLSNIIMNLEPFGKAHRELFTEALIEPLINELKAVVKSDEDRARETAGIENRVVAYDFKDNKSLEWLYPDSTKNLAKLGLQFKGFCPYVLATKDRLLIPGNIEVGVLHYRDGYYAFSNKRAAYEFAQNPDMYVRHIAEAAKVSPEMIQLLELHTQFAAISAFTTRTAEGQAKMVEKPITKHNMECQTDVHFMDSNIVKSYEWNEWELRRQALKLTNLRRKVTHSMQTDLSNLRRDNATQVYLPKDASTITKTDNYSNVPKPSVFYHGLRGQGVEPTQMTTIDLTLDVDQK